MFPFSIKFTRHFSRQLTDGEIEQASRYIEKRISDRLAKDIDVSHEGVFYKGSTSWSRSNIFNSVDRGAFKITNEERRSTFTYEIFMYKLIVFVSVISIIAWIGTGSYIPFGVFMGWVRV
jgi:hypothetical protein